MGRADTSPVQAAIQPGSSAQSGWVPTPRPELHVAGASDHFVQFYETDGFLFRLLGEFIGAGLRAGEAAIVVATPAHREGLAERLQALGLDVIAARRSGQYVELDAAAMLATFMVNGIPEPERFNEVFGGIIAQAAAGWHGVRVFGEMVALLWAQEHYEAAVALEALWNQLRTVHAFALCCGYRITGIGGEALAGPLSDVCAAHSYVIPAESYTALTNSDERVRAIVLLQQKARLLQAEVAERQAAEQRLQASEQRYRRLFEAAQDAILIVDPATGRIADANPAVTELLGFTRSELLEQELWAIGLFADPEANREALRVLHEQRSLRYDQLALRTKDGQWRDVELVSSLYQANGQQVIQCNLRDITRRKQAEDALRSLKDELQIQVADLQRLHELSSRLTATLDIESVLREVLRAALAMQGTDMGLLSLYDPVRDALGLKVQSGFDQAFLDRIAPTPPCAAACLARRQQVVVEDLARDPHFASYHEAVQLAGVRACHSTPLITRSGRIIGVLSVYFRRPHRPTERAARLMDLYAQMAADCIENAQLHQQVQQELAAREEALAREHIARAEAEHANRMKDEFLAMVSHELRTPLTTILGWAQRLRTGRRDAATMARGLEIIERHAKAQARLVDDLLDMSRVITGKLRLAIEPVDLAAVINAALDSIQLAADAKAIHLAVAIDPSARHISGDAGRLQQVVWNLLANAIKFTPAGGRVEVRLERAGACARLSVSDSGEGIGDDLLPFVFDRFRQADSTSSRKHGGLGLGLAIVRHLVELHGGTVSAESPGACGGATFTIQLPLVQR